MADSPTVFARGFVEGSPRRGGFLRAIRSFFQLSWFRPAFLQRVAVGVLNIAALAGCGAQTGLEEYDLGLDGGTLECFRDLDCQDGVDCTVDRCVGGLCVHDAVDTRCADDLACAAPRCDADLGCQSDPVLCDDGIECTVDRCEEPGGCIAEPDDSLCPVSHRCDASRGCVAQMLVHDGLRLYQVDLPSGAWSELTVISDFTDIALAPDRTLYACDTSAIYRLDERTGEETRVMTAPAPLVGLEVGPDGALYGAALDELVWRIDVASGTSAPIGQLPLGWVAAGDIAFIDGRMYITVSDDGGSRFANNALVELMADGTSRMIGPLGRNCVWGLAAFGADLYGLSCRGLILTIDEERGTYEEYRNLGLTLHGGAAR